MAGCSNAFKEPCQTRAGQGQSVALGMAIKLEKDCKAAWRNTIQEGTIKQAWERDSFSPRGAFSLARSGDRLALSGAQIDLNLKGL